MANDFSSLISRFNGSAWFITPEAMQMMLDILHRRMAGERLSDQEIRLRIESEGHDRQFSTGTVMRGVGVLPLYGPIFPKASLFTKMSGATSLEEFRQDFRSMMTNEYVSTILLDIDSPGGHADMIPEMAREIRTGKEVKPVVAVANTSANSAAYYLGSQATKLYATDSGQVGSIGVVLTHTDDTKKQEMEGEKVTYITAGKYKAELAEPLTEEARAYVQSHVDSLYEDFVQDVAYGRNTTVDDIRENYGEGRILRSAAAMEAGMIDGIKTFDSVLGRLIESGGDIRAIDSTPVPVLISGGGYPTATSSSGITTTFSYDADKEHSEPGTGLGGEPQPRTPPEEGDPAIKGGWRRDPPPIVYELEEEEMNREWLEARATALGVEFDEDATDEQLQEAITHRIDEVVAPMAVATAEADKQRNFMQDYPEQAAEIARLRRRDQEAEAHNFAESYATFADDSKSGFSGVVREKIESAHLGISERTFTQDGLKDLLDAVSSQAGIVRFGEAGSARDRERDTARPGATMQETRKMVADLVSQAQTEDGLDRDAAMAHVANQHPDLWNAYVSNR